MIPKNNFGFPNSIHIDSGNLNDAKMGMTNMSKLFMCVRNLNIEYKPYILADKMYDTHEFREQCISHNYTPIIDYNKRNLKNELLLKKLTKKEKKIYKKRVKVENTFCILKTNR